MSTRAGRRKTGGQRDGLFAWASDGTQPAEVEDNPLTRPCGWCHASPGEPCRRPSRRGWVTCPPHDARKTAGQVDQQPPASPPQRPAQPRTDTR